jgi:hypothetical protein
MTEVSGKEDIAKYVWIKRLAEWKRENEGEVHYCVLHLLINVNCLLACLFAFNKAKLREMEGTKKRGAKQHTHTKRTGERRWWLKNKEEKEAERKRRRGTLLCASLAYQYQLLPCLLDSLLETPRDGRDKKKGGGQTTHTQSERANDDGG